MSIYRIAAPAKLNLFLHVTGKRADGYHLLDSLVTFTEFGDTLEIVPADELMLEIAGPFAAALGSDNLVLRAAQLLRQRAGIGAGAHIRLSKHIPVSAGLGGGSADAAAVLRGLSQLWNVAIGEATLTDIALQIGSDVPVCLASQPAFMRGVGEQVTLVRLSGNASVVLVNPSVALATADVFRAFSGEFSKPCEMPHSISSFDALADFLEDKHNALEAAATTLLPVIGEVLAALKETQGCRLARMAGSGATCFGLYAKETHAVQAVEELQQMHPTWWCKATRLYETQ